MSDSIVTPSRASTQALPIPTGDWANVVHGVKRQVRHWAKATLPARPGAVVAYRKSRSQEPVQRLMVIEETWIEPIGVISEESLAEEGFETLNEFREYWCSRVGDYFEPLRKVRVYRIRPWRPGDAEKCALILLEVLYGSWLGEVETAAHTETP